MNISSKKNKKVVPTFILSLFLLACSDQQGQIRLEEKTKNTAPVEALANTKEENKSVESQIKTKMVREYLPDGSKEEYRVFYESDNPNKLTRDDGSYLLGKIVSVDNDGVEVFKKFEEVVDDRKDLEAIPSIINTEKFISNQNITIMKDLLKGVDSELLNINQVRLMDDSVLVLLTDTTSNANYSGFGGKLPSNTDHTFETRSNLTFLEMQGASLEKDVKSALKNKLDVKAITEIIRKDSERKDFPGLYISLSVFLDEKLSMPSHVRDNIIIGMNDNVIPKDMPDSAGDLDDRFLVDISLVQKGDDVYYWVGVSMPKNYDAVSRKYRELSTGNALIPGAMAVQL